MQKGEERGEKKGERAGLLEGIEALCRALTIELSPERKQQLVGADLATLRETLAQLSTSRSFPEP